MAGKKKTHATGKRKRKERGQAGGGAGQQTAKKAKTQARRAPAQTRNASGTRRGTQTEGREGGKRRSETRKRQGKREGESAGTRTAQGARHEHDEEAGKTQTHTRKSIRKRGAGAAKRVHKTRPDSITATNAANFETHRFSDRRAPGRPEFHFLKQKRYTRRETTKTFSQNSRANNLRNARRAAAAP